jgi:ubiquinol-cytochrome c reductase cytochrome b subunit
MAGRAPVIGEWLLQLVLAGQNVGGSTLTRFYASHVFLLPALIFLFVGVHLYLVVRHGISEPPRAGEPVEPETYPQQYEELIEKEGIPFWPDAAWRDVVFALAIGAVVLVLALFLGPKALGPPADPTVLDTSPRPDWYFLWLFALLALSPPELENYLMIGGPLLVGAALLLLPLLFATGERSVRRRPWALATVGSVAVALGVLIWLGNEAPWSPELSPPALPPEVVARAEAAGVERGAELFAAQGCISCHSIDGVGGHRGPELTAIGSRLSEDELIWRISIGGRNMPPYGDTLTPEEIENLVAFLELQKGLSD